MSSMILMSAAKRISLDFPILKEARREVLEDKMDVINASKVLKEIEDGNIEIKEINTTLPSPFAFNLALMGYSDILKMEDKIDFLRRMHEMVLAKISLEKGLSSDDKGLLMKEAILATNYGTEFSYEKEWEIQESAEQENMKIEAEDKKDKLIYQLKRASHKIDLNPQIEYECVRLINGEREGFKSEFTKWLNQLLSGAIPNAWEDDIIKFFQEVRSKI